MLISQSLQSVSQTGFLLILKKVIVWLIGEQHYLCSTWSNKSSTKWDSDRSVYYKSFLQNLCSMPATIWDSNRHLTI